VANISHKKARTHLNEQERVAIDRYFSNGFNKTEAITFAGYKSGNAYISRWYARDTIATEIERRMRAMTKKSKVTAEMVIEEVRKVAFANLGDLITVQEDGSALIEFSTLTADQRASISEFQTETYNEGRGDDAVPVKKQRVKFHSKLDALEKLGKYFKIFNEKIEVTGTISLEDRIMRGRDRARGERAAQEAPDEEEADV